MDCIKKITDNLKGLYLFIFIALCFASVAIASEPSSILSATADSMHFRVSYKSKVEPLPLNRIHSWILHVESSEGKPVENAEISVYGGMPAHKHGLPTEPVVSEIGAGDYLLEGIKFSMGGKWEIWLNISAGDLTEKVKFNIEF